MELVVKLTALSDVGLVRERNEDAIGIDGWSVQCTRARPLTMIVPVTDRWRVAVCDGMGGHSGGAEASWFAARRVTDPRLDEVAVGMQEASNALVKWGASDAAMRGMGTTCVVFEAHASGQARVYHVGDSRAYLIDPDLAPLTRDDRQSPDAPSLTQAMGGYLAAALDVHRFEFALHEGQRVLLCSDGLVDMVSDAEIERLVGGQGAAASLAGAAREAGGRDNITVVLVEVLTSPLARQTAADVLL